MDRIAILLTCHNRKDITLRCLTSLYEASMPNDITFEVYLTDDGCTDGTVDSIRKKYREIHIIKGDGTLFWNRGMYKAWAEASKFNFDYYLWLNDDTFLLYNAFVLLIKLANENRNSIIVGATKSNLNIISYGGWKNKKLINPTKELVECDYFNGNVVLIPQSVFLIVGNLDYHYRHSIGDYDYGLTAKRKGIKSYQTSDFVGICNRHKEKPFWYNPKYPLRERLKIFYSPLGENPTELFYYGRKNWGIFKGIFLYIRAYIKLFFCK